jgi:hypothetical protein
MKLRQLFENSNTQFLQTREEISNWLLDNTILKPHDFQINADLTVDVFSSFKIFMSAWDYDLYRLPVRFGYCTGSFALSRIANLQTLEGCPTHVEGSFFCERTGIQDLQGAPREVGGDFFCGYSESLMSLVGAPDKVGRNFKCNNCPDLESLEGGPSEVGYDYNCSYNALRSLVGAPREIGGEFDCSNNELFSLKGAPRDVGLSFDCANNNLTSLKGAPLHIGEDLIAWGNQIAGSANYGYTPRSIGGEIIGVE